ncbi:hypothetical protein AAY84_23830 [Serratia marcescens]|uniref:YfbU family protein n=1 Tax=Enterobacterales TaxID=91347 RepID=UPI00062C2EAF|nr:YfbU family protein [Serratia marcescens]KKZ15820.1 hypothetical protein AAY84_23830 [Serratia marcescens]
MQYGDLQKMNTLMLCDIFDTLNISNGYDTELIRTAVNLNQLWAIELAYPGHTDNTDIPDEVDFISNVMNLFHDLKSAFSNFNEQEKRQISRVIPDFSEKYDLEFSGFHPQLERNMADISRLLVMLGYYSEDDLLKNACTPATGRYIQMLEFFTPFQNRPVKKEIIPPEIFCEIVLAGRNDYALMNVLRRNKWAASSHGVCGR